ncbi:hypothetical protein Cni_G06149 [Canna indica]|uniref:Uncharacterized protein n=1 Tax=Canna indica TaxID=4628 RepID=A0AAQ3JWF1_9LILI|nr:hypothetical protein Cni_G06149 [Canna indica]
MFKYYICIIWKRKRQDKTVNASAGVDVDANGDEEDGDETEEDDGVDEYGDAAGLEVAELHHPVPPRQLKQQPRRQQHEQHHRYHHRPPVRHSLSLSVKPLRVRRAARN